MSGNPGGKPDAKPGESPQSQAPLALARDLIDRLLVLDVFVVLAGALWFAVAVVASGSGLKAPLELFQRLWEPLFTPAIGLLMGAALLSGALGWWQRRGQGRARGGES
jgi:Mn2+/Fe2+ NRAMP family transporter